ncbi:MAG TPA: ATP-binding protein, partial [Anaerolineales bacterium]|nr:ATP-binding protein [Anaerolineales bacterium]
LENRVVERTNALAQVNAELHRLVRQRQNLLDMTRKALFTLSLDELLSQVIAMLGTLLGPDDYLGFFWLNEVTGMLEPYKCVPETAPNHEPWPPVKPGEGVTGAVAVNRVAILGNFVHEDPRFLKVACPFTHVISIPIQARQKLLGVFNAGRFHDQPFSQEDFETVEIFLSLAAIAIDNANLFEQVKQRETILESRIVERTVSLQVEVQERKQAERDLQTAYFDLKMKTEALERSNTDLEQFAYVSYHDLQEPLRQVMLYTQRLARSTDDASGEEKMEWMAFVLEGAQRMQNLIKGLLHYTSIGRMKVILQPVNSDRVLQETLAALSLDIKSNGATIYHEYLPWVWSDAFLLRELFQNLVGNALKFSSHIRPEIRIFAIPDLSPDQEEASRWRFAIQDNGIGIDALYFDRIFDIFQRLHSRDQYEGTGVGLAICKKIVEHHHSGRIWVVSKEGEGATFYFTLPRVPQFIGN